MTEPREPDWTAIRTVRRFAALSGHFDPRDALRAVPELGPDDVDRLVPVTAHLANACDTGDGRQWLMRGPERRWELTQENETVPAAVAWRRDAGPATEDTRDLLDALAGTGMFTEPVLRDRLETPTSRPELARLAVALDRAGPLAPSWPQLDGLRAALARLDIEERGTALLASGFVGRTAELAEILRWIAVPASPARALFVGGLPGIGKSTLIEEAIRRVRVTADWIVVRLDFDRTGLDVLDQTGLTIEVARQVAAQAGGQAHELREARLEAAGGHGTIKGTARDRVPIDLADTLAARIRDAGRPVLLVLDTLEVLRGRGETHPIRLFQWIDALHDRGFAPLSVLAAGRGDALDTVAGRVGSRIDVTGLSDEDADALLTGLAVPPAAFASIHAVAQGNPLVLRLAAAAAAEAGPAALRRTVPRKDLAAAYLYRFLHSRIADPDLRALAHPGLVVRRISAELIAEVLAPRLGVGRISAERAAALLAALSQQHWLMEPDPAAPGFLRHRADLLRAVLPLLYQARPAKCAELDRAAAAWFGARTEPWATVESAYHRLQLMRRDATPPPLDPVVLRQLDGESIGELPRVAQNLVHRVRGERTSLGRVADRARAAVVTQEETRELEAIIERGDWVEGAHVYDRVFRGAVFDGRSREADVARAFLWRCGRWHEARRLLGDAGGVARIGELPPTLAAPLAEMWAEVGLPLDPAGREQAARLMSIGLRSSLDQGALGFVLRAAGAVVSTESWRPFDTVAATLSYWSDAGASPDSARAFASASERFGMRMLGPDTVGQPKPGPADRVAAARLLAVLTPYGELGRTLSLTRGTEILTRHAAAVDRALSAKDASPSVPIEPIDKLVETGLFAEWAGAAAFVLRDPDLALIARSAERWRRTTAGLWSYGRPPTGWRGVSGPLDVTLANRLAELLNAADPISDSRRQMAAWFGGATFAAAIRRRLPRVLAQASQSDSPASVLVRHRVPSAFIPPLAVLLARRAL